MGSAYTELASLKQSEVVLGQRQCQKSSRILGDGEAILGFLLAQRQAVGVDERAQIGGDLLGNFFEFFTGGIAGKLVPGRWSIRCHGDDRAVARVRSRRVSEFVEMLHRIFEVIDADIKNQASTGWLATDQQSPRAILLIGFGEDPGDAYSLLK